jgi:hypothetical protein
MGWTHWRKIADRWQWYGEHFDHDGPACYELGTGGPRGGAIQPHYVGETSNERSRIQCYAKHGSRLSKIIDWHLKNGWYLYYRARCCATKEAAKQMQDNLLRAFQYDWNVVLKRIEQGKICCVTT